MASSGPNSPGTAAEISVPSGGAWGDYDYAKSSDNNRTIATTGIFSASHSYYLLVTNFGFSIPSGATIDGIVVEVERKSSTGVAQDLAAQITKDEGSNWSDNKATNTSLPTTDTYKTFGSSSDLWGMTLSPSDINSSDFGFGYRIGNDNVKYTDNPSVDHIRITVYYTEGSTGYTHKVIGIASPGKVGGVANADIGKVIGVE